VETSGTWHIVTWNIRGNHSPKPRAIASALSSLADGGQFDVIALQEVRRLQAWLIARRLGLRHVWAFKHNGYTALLPLHAEGHAVLTPHRFERHAHETISAGERRRSFRRRIALWADIERDGSHLRVIDTHLASHDLPTARLEQAARVRHLVESSPVDCVVAGDFNDKDEPAVVSGIARDSHVDAWPHAISRGGNGLTNPSAAPHQRLDHLLVPVDWVVDEVRVPFPDALWESLSDHLPVVAHCQMRSK